MRVYDESETALREELKLVEQDLGELRDRAADLRRQIGERFPTDEAERASLLTAAEEQEVFIATLEQRREGLQRRLGAEGVGGGG